LLFVLEPDSLVYGHTPQSRLLPVSHSTFHFILPAHFYTKFIFRQNVTEYVVQKKSIHFILKPSVYVSGF